MSNPAETYESYMVPALFAPWASRLIERARPRPGERVLDVACGTGVVARHVASIVGSEGKVVGLDASPNMLDVARAVAKQERVRVQWHEGRAESLPFPDGSFDLVMCQFALMFFEDRHAALKQMHRVLTADGRLALSVWQSFDRHPFYRRLDEAIEHRAGLSGVRDIFAIGDSAELRRLVLDAGFSAGGNRVRLHDRAFPRSTGISSRRDRCGHGRNPIDAASRRERACCHYARDLCGHAGRVA